MEHHSNQTSWLETIADVEVIPSTEDGLFSIENLEILLSIKTELSRLRPLLPAQM
jgi:selenocysteine lyase/cysteine desulfurase